MEESNDVQIFEEEVPSEGEMEETAGMLEIEEDFDEMQELMEKTTSWHILLTTAIILSVFLIFYYREFFSQLPSAQVVSRLPYTAGANLRTLSVDSSLNR
jgi:hypothetical protein